MGLDIRTSDDERDFHIGYMGFSTMRSFFILHYSEDSYIAYNNVLRASMTWSINADRVFNRILKKIGDLSILIDHSDCDGELTSEECKKLKPCLFVDEDKINAQSTVDNNEYYNRIIKKMYEFIDLIDYCASNPEVKLIFG